MYVRVRAHLCVCALMCSLNFFLILISMQNFLSFYVVLFCTYVHFYDFGFLLSFRLTLTLSCAMNFASYPHDTQTCSLQMESCKFPELNSNCFIASYFRLEIFLTSLKKDGFDIENGECCQSLCIDRV